MGKIIKFDFINKERISEKGEIKNPQKKPVDIKDHIKEQMGEAVPFIKFITFAASEKGRILLNLTITPLAFSQAKEIVKNYKDEELTNWLLNHSEAEWQSKPSFYRAVYEELNFRAGNIYNPKEE